ncbi:MAG: restriction endonuclease subunit S [Xanthomonadales bacterium]|nr:restriction endonuclease subunit S [Xanthomonadales bacterium]
MIADLKPYPKYKDSGLPWVGQVPAHWKLVPNRGLVRRRKVLVGKRHADYRLLSLTKQGVIVRDMTTGKGKFSSDMGTSQEVRSGDIVFCLFDVPETPRTVGLSRHDGMITGAYTVFESRGKGSTEYFELFYRALDDRKLLSPLYSGLRNTIPVDRLLGTKTPQPPPEEQAAIVRFLDWANIRLERAIRAKRQVIVLLNEQKQATIYRTVTRGLDPLASIKCSGIAWIGDIPSRWTLRRVKSISQVKRGSSPRPIADIRYFSESGEYGWVRIRDVTACNGYLTSTAERLSDIGKSKSVPIEPGSLFLSIAGSVGKAAITKIKCCIHDGFVYFPKITSNAEYLYYVFSCGRIYDGLGNVGTQLNLNTETVGAICVPWPSPREQVEIAAFCDKESDRFAEAISRLEREIEFLREYHARLVTDVVTGKLDVRAVAATLPDAPAQGDDNDDVLDDDVLDEEALETDDMDAAA